MTFVQWCWQPCGNLPDEGPSCGIVGLVVGLFGYRETDFGSVLRVSSLQVWAIHLKNCLFDLGKEDIRVLKRKPRALSGEDMSRAA